MQLKSHHNTRAVLFIRYSGPFLKWTREELINRPEDKKFNDDAQSLTYKRWDRLYMSRKEGSGLARTGDSVNASIRRFEDFIETSKERLITAISNTSDNIRTNRTTKLRNRNGKKNNCMDISSNKLAKSGIEDVDIVTEGKPQRKTLF